MSKLFKLSAVLSLPLLFFVVGAPALGQNIISNGSFDTNIGGWDFHKAPGEPPATEGDAQWSSDGSLFLINNASLTNQFVSVTQCQDITGGANYDVAAGFNPHSFSTSSNSIAPASSRPLGIEQVEHTGIMDLLLSFYTGSSCTGSVLSQFVQLSANTGGTFNDKWQTQNDSFTAPGTAQSVLVQLEVSKTQAGSALSGNFDDIYLAPSGGIPPPAAEFTFTPSSPSPGQVVKFTDASTGGPTSYSWNFGDPGSGSANTSTLQNPSHTFATAGTYTVTLTVSNLGGTGMRSHPVTVAFGPPVADFNYTPNSPLAGQSVQFTDISSNAPTAWSWDFGDPGSGSANASSLQNPTHVFAAAGVYNVRLIATNAAGNGSRTNAVTVSGGAGSPLANFTFTPPSPMAGQAVVFTDTSSGSPTAWSWNFGDPGSGFANTSSLQNPTHVFSLPGTYTVTLAASNAAGTGTRSNPVGVSASSVTTRAVSLPVAGHVTGVGGVVFVTDAQIENPSAAATAATLFFYPVGGGAASQLTLSLAPLETRSLPDVVANQFGVTNSFGALRLETTGAPPAPLRMTSRTYDRPVDGSFGMAISGVVGTGASSTSRIVTGLQRNDLFRSNIGAVNDSPLTESFAIVLRGADGSVLGTSAAVTLPPSGQWQVGIKDLFPNAFADALTAEFQSTGGSAVPIAYGALADNQSGDPTYFPSLRPASVALLPVISRITGVGGALFSSDLTIANISDSAVVVTLTFWEHDRDNTAGARQTAITLAPRETRLIADALNALFGLSETFGALKIESAGSLAVAERIWTASPTTAGTVGQQVDPVVLPDALYARASILGLRQDSAFRANAGFINPNDSSATIGLTLRRPSGATIGAASVSVPPRGFRQFSLPGLFPGVAFPPGELLTIALDAGAAGVCAYGIIADNVSQDLTASPALP